MEPRPKNPELVCLKYGQWSQQAHQCEPIYGKVTTNIQGEGFFAESFEYFLFYFLWIFRWKHDHDWNSLACSHLQGQRAYLWRNDNLWASGDDCFSIATNNIQGIDYKRFKVAAGKIKRALDEVESPAAQIRGIQEVGISAR